MELSCLAAVKLAFFGQCVGDSTRQERRCDPAGSVMKSELRLARSATASTASIGSSRQVGHLVQAMAGFTVAVAQVRA
jgi:hypothetical protein